MQVDITVTVNIYPTSPGALGEVNETLETILERITPMATALEDLVREVSESQTVTASAIALLQGLKTALDAAIAANDMSAVAAAAAALDAQQAELVAAITANTPAAAAP